MEKQLQVWALKFSQMQSCLLRYSTRPNVTTFFTEWSQAVNFVYTCYIYIAAQSLYSYFGHRHVFKPIYQSLHLIIRQCFQQNVQKWHTRTNMTQSSYRQVCVKFKDFSRTSKRLSYCFQRLKTYEKY